MGASVDPATVRLRKGGEAACFRCGRVVPATMARFILADLYANQWLSGRPMVYCSWCVADMRERIALELPLSAVDFARALREGWFEHGTLDIFVGMTGVLSYQRQERVCSSEAPCAWCRGSPWHVAGSGRS